MASESNGLQEWLPYLSPLAILISAWWASRNAVKAIEANREASRKSIENADTISRKKNAIDMIMRTQSDTRLHAAYKKIRAIHENGKDITIYAYNGKIGDDDGLDGNEIGYVLNHFEHLANGINQGIFDEETIRRSQWGTITNIHKYCTKFIDTVRDRYSRPTIYIELEDLAKRWKDKPPTKIT